VLTSTAACVFVCVPTSVHATRNNDESTEAHASLVIFNAHTVENGSFMSATDTIQWYRTTLFVNRCRCGGRLSQV